MKKINFSDLNLEVDKSTTEIEFNGQRLEVLKYLPCADKMNILITTLQEAYDAGVYDPMRLEMFLHLNLALMYCQNISFSEEDISNPFLIYDKLHSSGLLDMIIEKIDDEEYEFIWTNLIELAELKGEYNSSFIGVLEKMQVEMPEMMEQMQSLMQNFDQEQINSVVNFTAAANGGRDIIDNQPME